MNSDKSINPLKKDWELVNFCEFDKYATKSYCAIHGVDESLNLGDITKVDETKLKPFNTICGGSPCFMAGTKVITKNGYKNIENISVGDMVLTHKNRYMPVVKIGGEKNKEIYSMRVQGFLNIECTDYHPFYCKKTKNSSPEKIKLKDLHVGYYLGSHINKIEDNRFDLSDEDCWILGRYVADGHVRKGKRKDRKNSFQYQCVLSIGDNKVDELKSIVKTRHYNCYPHTESTHRVVFSSMELVNFIIEHGFGMGAENKVIPNLILDLPISKLKWFLNGYMAGDGCEICDIYQATTVSKELAMSLCLAIQKVYRVGCCVYHDERPNSCIIEGRTVNQKDTYMIRFRKNSQKHLWFVEDDIVWYPIRKITKTDKIENVFNIEVEEDHTYTANNIITYNCQDFSVAGKQKGSVWTCKECEHEYNPLTVHWSERGKCPNCSSENIEKTRSSLLVEYLRVVRANRPNFGIYENVKNIVGRQFKDTTFKLFTDELEEYGYNVYWKVLNAKNYGIPQNRERVYLIFIKKDLDNGKFQFPKPFDNGIRLKDMLEDVVDQKYYLSKEVQDRFKLTDETFTKNIIGTTKPEFRTIGQNDLVYQKDSVMGALVATDYKQPKQILDNDVKTVAIPQATKKGYIECEIGGVADLSYPDSKTRRGRVQDGGNICPTLTATETGVCRIESAKKELTHAEWKQKMFNKFVEDSNGEVSGVITNQSQSFGYRPPMKGFSKTLRANANDTGVVDGLKIRKLTPKECFRLMGFSDENFNAAHNVGISNSQLYKQAGNSIVVDVLYYIFVELYKAMPYLFDDLRLSSFFSGIGAFEVALDRLYEGINSGNFTNPQAD